MRFPRQNKPAIKFVIVPFASGSTTMKLTIFSHVLERCPRASVALCGARRRGSTGRSNIVKLLKCSMLKARTCEGRGRSGTNGTVVLRASQKRTVTTALQFSFLRLRTKGIASHQRSCPNIKLEEIASEEIFFVVVFVALSLVSLLVVALSLVLLIESELFCCSGDGRRACPR